MPPYYQPWMDIALHVPELVQSHELRSHINKVKGENKLTRRVLYILLRYSSKVVFFPLFSCLDAAAEHQVSAETQRVTAGPPGPKHDDHGICLAGRREQHHSGIFIFLPYVLTAARYPKMYSMYE